MRSKFRLTVLLFALVLITIFLGLRWLRLGTRMPGKSYAGILDPLDPYQIRLRDNLKSHVGMLAGQIGERNTQHVDALNRAADYIKQTMQLREYAVSEYSYQVNGKTARILYASLHGKDVAEPFVVGAHYDSVAGSPGANDNASGVAAVLELARMLKDTSPERSITFVFFPNEEPPYFQTKEMGSLVFARGFRQGVKRFSGMISVETIGYYSDQKGSQKYPASISSLYPDRGDFIGFVGDIKSRELLKKAIADFRWKTHFPSEGASLPRWIDGVGFSDHWSFWQVGAPAIMVTDTAPFRYPYYHQPGDTPDKIDYEKMARVVLGLKHVVLALANEQSR